MLGTKIKVDMRIWFIIFYCIFCNELKKEKLEDSQGEEMVFKEIKNANNVDYIYMY
jgi:hypothetical protein